MFNIVGWRCGLFAVSNLSWIGTCLMLLTISIPMNCRPVPSPFGSTTLDESSPHRDEPLFFDSQRNTESDNFKTGPLNNSGMIVRVIVTSSSSSSSSDSDDSDFSSFHDFRFPHQSSEVQTPVVTSSTIRPTTYHPEYSELRKNPKSGENISREPVEDIFSAFYRAFSEASPGFSVRDSPLPLMSDSRHVERFQAFPRSSSSTEKPRVSELRNRKNNNDFRETVNKQHDEDEEVASDNSKSNTAIVSSSVAVSHQTSSKSVAVAVPRSRKVSLSTSTSSSISLGVGNGVASSRSTTRVSKPIFFRRPGRVDPMSSESTSSANLRGSKNENTNDGSIINSQAPEAQPLVQESSSFSTITQISREPSTPSSPRSWQQPEKIWSEPAKVWSLPAEVWSEPAKVWGQPAKNWGEPARNWGQPEKLWGQSEQSLAPQSEQKSQVTYQRAPTPRSPLPSPNIRRSIYESKPMKSYEKITQKPHSDSSEEFESQEDEDYQRDSEQPEPEGGDSTQGTFVILGDDENEQDSIDGEFDRHLVLPVSTSTTQKPSHVPYNANNNVSNNYRNNKTPNSIASGSATNISNTSGNSSNSQLTNSNNKKGKKFGYVLEGSNVRRYRVEERTPDGYIVGEYGVLNNQNAFLRGVRYTADGTINPRLIHEALMKFLSLRRR